MQRDQHPHHDAGGQAARGLLRRNGQRCHQRGKTGDHGPAHGQRRRQHIGRQMQEQVKPLPEQQERGKDGQRVEQGDGVLLHAACTPRSARETSVTRDSNCGLSRVSLVRGNGR